MEMMKKTKFLNVIQNEANNTGKQTVSNIGNFPIGVSYFLFYFSHEDNKLKAS